jgi:hypothetical protein
MNVQANQQTTSPRPGPSSLDLSRETYGKAVQVWDGVWLIATRHRPGLSRHMFEVNNRCLVFRLEDRAAGGPVLLVVNAVDPAEAIPEVKRLERETGLGVRYLLSPGGGHHLMMAPWHEQFPVGEGAAVPGARAPHRQRPQPDEAGPRGHDGPRGSPAAVPRAARGRGLSRPDRARPTRAARARAAATPSSPSSAACSSS